MSLIFNGAFAVLGVVNGTLASNENYAAIFFAAAMIHLLLFIESATSGRK
jgi:hypothetical protein